MKNAERRSVHWLVKLFVVFHLAAITLWSLPRPGTKPVGTDIVLVWNERYFRPSAASYYLTATGFWQYWDMFAPNPSAWDGWVDAVVTFQDGTSLVFQYPRMKRLPPSQKYVKERYRKFLERAHAEEYQWLWPRFAQRIALEAARATGKVPHSVSLRRHWKIVQPPGRPQWPDYREFVYYEHIVDVPRLKRELGA